MSDGDDRSPSPRRKLTRDRRQRIIPGAATWVDTEDSEGRETPDADAPRRDPSYRPPRTYRRAGAGSARHGHSDQEAPATPRHYSQDAQGARSQEGPVTMNNVACTICQSQQHLDLDCPQQTCTLCGVVGHHALYCNPASEGHHTLSESSPPGVRGPSRDHLRHQQDPELQQQQDLAHFLERQPDATPDQQQEFLQHLELQRAQDERDRLSRQDLQQVRGAGGGPGHVTAQVQASPTDGVHRARTME